MVYGIVKLINFAHGDIIMVGAYFALFSIPVLERMGLPIWLCILVAGLLCAVLGMLIETIAYKPLRKAPKLCSIITAIGMSLFLQNMALLLWSASPQSFIKVFSTTTAISLFQDSPNEFVRHYFGLQLSTNAILTIVVSLALMCGMQFFVKFSKSGRAMRCVSEDMGAAKLMGINVNRTITMTFAIGSALAAVGSVFWSNSYPVIDPTMGSMLGLKAFIAAVLGGIGIIPGAILGALIIGLAESITKTYNSQLADAIVFGILIIILLIKPAGILGKNTKVKV